MRIETINRTEGASYAFSHRAGPCQTGYATDTGDRPRIHRTNYFSDTRSSRGARQGEKDSRGRSCPWTRSLAIDRGSRLLVRRRQDHHEPANLAPCRNTCHAAHHVLRTPAACRGALGEFAEKVVTAGNGYSDCTDAT